jgi:hypothetical protein
LPYHPEYKKIYSNNMPSEKEFVEFLQTYSRKKGVGFIDLHDSIEETNQFKDIVHLNTLGAISTTNRLTDVLKQSEFIKPKDFELTDLDKK